MKKYPRTPSRGGPMTAKIESVRQGEAALAHAPSRDEWLAKWGLRYPDAQAMRLGLHNQCLSIPFFAADGTLLGVKLRKLGAGRAAGGLRYFWQSPGNAPPIYLPPEGLDGGSVLVTEGPFKGRALTVILGRPVCALASGVRVGLPKDAVQHFRGKDVHYISDPDDEGMAGSEILARQLRGVAKSLKAIPFPPRGWMYKGQKTDDLNDVLRLLRSHHPGIEVAFPGIAAWIERELEKAPDLLNGGPADRTTESPIGPEFQDLTQLFSAGQFVSDHQKSILWCQGEKGFFVWTGGVWGDDTMLEIQNKARVTILRLMREGVEMRDRKRGDAILQFSVRLQHRDQMDAMIAMAKPYLAARIEDFDRDPMLFNCQNGTLDLRTGTLREHRREDRITKLSPVTYDVAAQCPLFDRFLDRIMGGDLDRIRYLQKFFGYSLTGDMREDLFTIFHGDGANGKTTLVNAVRHALGDYARTAAPKLFIHTQWDAHPSEIADLYRARLVVVGETDEDQRLNVARIKAHTGKEKLIGRGMYKSWFEFHATHKVVWLTNHRPVIQDTTHAMKRRVRLVPFTVRISDEERDLTLGEKLIAEAPGILRWIVEGCFLWQKEGLKSPEAVEVATEAYRIESDPVARFLAEQCVVAANASVKRDALRAAFVLWSDQEGDRHPVTARNFAGRLRDLGIEDGAIMGQRTWKGVGLAVQE